MRHAQYSFHMARGSDIDFFEGFRWAIPLAFSSAVSACRFEQGDVLYSARKAYERWTRKAMGFEHHIQVFDPPKTTRALAGDGERKRFFANWDSPVELELADLGSARVAKSTTTQGRLFTCLWRGDVSWLAPESASPEPPVLQRELHKQLSNSLPAFRKRFGRGQTSRRGAASCLYLAVVDRASDTGRAKIRSIEVALAQEFAVKSVDLLPAQAGLDGAERFHPALQLRGLCIAGADASEVESCLKALLYVGSAEGKADRFSLSRHGLLLPLDANGGLLPSS